jgi:hypothetical protein
MNTKLGVIIAAVLAITTTLSFWSISAFAQLTTSNALRVSNTTTTLLAQSSIPPEIVCKMNPNSAACAQPSTPLSSPLSTPRPAPLKSTAGQATPPRVTITSPTKNSSLPLGIVLVTGNSSPSPGGSAIRDVKVHVDKGAYSSATPKANGDWSKWSIKLNISTAGPHVIQARATDIAGNQNWHRVPVNVSPTSVITKSTPALGNKSAVAAAPTTNATAVTPTTVNKSALAPVPTKPSQHKSIPSSAFPGLIP